MNEKKYEEIGDNYRFFLSWRHATFVGDIVIVFGVLSLTFSTYKDIPSIAWIIPLIGAPVSILLWIIDVRNRDLYHAAIRAGKVLEGKEGGFFTELSKEVLSKGESPFKMKTQSGALNILFWGSSVSLLILSIVLFCMAR